MLLLRVVQEVANYPDWRYKGLNDVFTGNYLCNWSVFTFAIITQGLK